MQILLERHRYAPELNKAYVGPNRVMVPAPGCTSIKEVREKIFAPLKRTGRYVRIHTRYPEPYDWLNRTRQGFCEDLDTLKRVLSQVKSGLAMQHDPYIKVKVEIVG